MNSTGGSKTRELENDIGEMIVADGLRQGDPILSENKLVELFGVSRVTVRQALANLVAADVLYKVKGKGTFVSNANKLSGKQRQPVMTRTLALVMGSITNSHFAELAKGLEDVARDEGYQIMFCSSNSVPTQEEEILRDLLKRRVDGIFFSPGESLPLPTTLKQLCLSLKNVVILDNPVSGIGLNSVSCDDCEGGYLAVNYLLQLGHRRIAHLKGPDNVMNAYERYNGYLKALTEAGIAVNQDFINSPGSYAYEDGKAATAKWLQLPTSERPTAIFAANDELALGAYDGIIEHGLSVPGDISVIGYGSLMKPLVRGVALSTVKQNPYQIGKTACRVLLEQIAGQKTTHKLLLQPELVIKETCSEVTS